MAKYKFIVEFETEDYWDNITRAQMFSIMVQNIAKLCSVHVHKVRIRK